MTQLHKALYKTLMEVKRKADCEQPLATIDVTDDESYREVVSLFTATQHYRCTRT